jgi:protein gp37
VIGYGGLSLAGIDWLIVGGESGGRIGRRLVDENNQPREDRAQWVRDLRDHAICSDTAFLFKQWGGPRPESGGRLLDGREWSEFPASRAPVAA